MCHVGPLWHRILYRHKILCLGHKLQLLDVLLLSLLQPLKAWQHTRIYVSCIGPNIEKSDFVFFFSGARPGESRKFHIARDWHNSIPVKHDCHKSGITASVQSLIPGCIKTVMPVLIHELFFSNLPVITEKDCTNSWIFQFRPSKKVVETGPQS